MNQGRKSLVVFALCGLIVITAISGCTGSKFFSKDAFEWANIIGNIFGFFGCQPPEGDISDESEGEPVEGEGEPAEGEGEPVEGEGEPVEGEDEPAEGEGEPVEGEGEPVEGEGEPAEGEGEPVEGEGEPVEGEGEPVEGEGEPVEGEGEPAEGEGEPVEGEDEPAEGEGEPVEGEGEPVEGEGEPVEGEGEPAEGEGEPVEGEGEPVEGEGEPVEGEGEPAEGEGEPVEGEDEPAEGEGEPVEGEGEPVEGEGEPVEGEGEPVEGEGEPVEGEGEPVEGEPGFCNPDLDSPVLNLAGDQFVLLEDCTAYEEAGLASVIDLCDGDLGANLTPEDVMVDIWIKSMNLYVNTTLASVEYEFNSLYAESIGEYAFVYYVNDSSGNTGSVERNVRTVCLPDQVEELTVMLPGNVPLVLVRIPSGTFTMGCNPDEQDSYYSELPQHEVVLEQDFWMGKYEVTQQQWLAVMNTWPDTVPSSAVGLGDNYPAYWVSWYDAQDYVTALNAYLSDSYQDAIVVRLPSESEWEYACRAGTTTRYYWGDDPDYVLADSYAWHRFNSDGSAHPVGEKLPNAFGLYDMSGNVWEWCGDDWHDDYIGAPNDGSIWVDSPRNLTRMLRGSGWSWEPEFCRSAKRGGYMYSYDHVGFRLVADDINNEGEGEPVEGEGELIEGEGEPLEGEGELVEGEGEPVEDELTVMLPGNVPLVLLRIPSGTFTMGCNPDEQDSYYSELPQHEVVLEQDFWMGKYEVTQQQWLAVMNTWPDTVPSSAVGQGDNYPAYWVSWYDAQDYVTALNAYLSDTFQDAIAVRLPSESEWEYACRAGTTTRYYWGDDPDYVLADFYAWHSFNSDGSAHPVGEKIPNAFGLYDMSGNVWEWCGDDWHDDYIGAPDDGSIWVDSPRNIIRMLRGSGWSWEPNFCRSAKRGGYKYSYDHVGFRLAADGK
jgi:formylglycine-generating enzyme required for sulfatase activity